MRVGIFWAGSPDFKMANVFALKASASSLVVSEMCPDASLLPGDWGLEAGAFFPALPSGECVRALRAFGWGDDALGEEVLQEETKVKQLFQR